MASFRRCGWIGIVLLLAGAGSFVQIVATPPAATAQPAVTIQAAGRGNPYINFADGREIPAVYSGSAAAESAVASSGAHGLALASADFDEDGMPDLVASFDSPTRGLISLHFGNVDAVYPNAPEAKKRRAEGKFVDAPFLPDAKVFETLERPDFIGAGDFDADGHWDVVAARKGGDKLALHRGDGAGGLLPPESLPLPGAVTALATGDVNRRDGLEDVLVGVDTPSGARLLVFEWPDGALRGKPEEIELANPAADIAIGQLDGSYPIDIAVAAGKQLVILNGRDRKLTFPEKRRSDVGTPQTIAVSAPAALRALAIGDFDADGALELASLGDDGSIRVIAVADLSASSSLPAAPSARIDSTEAQGSKLVAARVSSLGSHDLILAGGSGLGIRILTGDPELEDQLQPIDVPARAAQFTTTTLDGQERPAAILSLRLNSDALADIVSLSTDSGIASLLETRPLSTFIVSNTNDSGSGSLRAAILAANASAGVDTIIFNIPGITPHTIQPLTALPWTTEAVTLDATTEPDFGGTPVVFVDGSNLAGTNWPGLGVTGSPAVIRGLAIGRAPIGTFLDSLGGNIVEGNFIGTDVTGTVLRSIHYWGIQSTSALGDLVGGTTAAARNITSGSSRGIFFIDGMDHRASGNYVGTDVSGTNALPNVLSGVTIANAPITNTTIGGTSTGSRNIISGNEGAGIVTNYEVGGGTLIQGNFIGSTSTGSAALPNHVGILLDHARPVTIGGTTPGARNIISGNTEEGIGLHGSTHVVQNNYIGLQFSGFGPLQNGTGIGFASAFNCLIGGTSPAARNVISGNAGAGISLIPEPLAAADGNDILGNFIGLSDNGLFPLGNRVGIELVGGQARANHIGGSSVSMANIVSANQTAGILVSNGAHDNIIEVNLIGTDAVGNSFHLLDNIEVGIRIQDAPDNVVGIKQGQGNIIVGSPIGLHISGPGSTGNLIQGNRIGTSVDGTTAAPYPNERGVVIDQGASNNIIGGGLPDGGNLISGNTGGVEIADTATGFNRLRGNLIGTDVSGSTALPNMVGLGVLDASDNEIGGPSPGDRNIVASLNNNLRIQYQTAAPSRNVVAGNYFGTDASGTVPLAGGIAPNVVLAGAQGTILRNNVIGGNHTLGLQILDTSNSVVEGNLIGVSPTMTSIGVSGAGISVLGSSSNNHIGRTGPGGGNSIANNLFEGIRVQETSTGNGIRGNSIWSNGGLGIELVPNGVNPNDPGDPDSGANSQQNFPVITSAVTTGGSVRLEGTLSSAPSTLFTLDFYSSPSCDPSGHGEGAHYLGSTTVATDGVGNTPPFSVDRPGIISAGAVITATATDPAGNTSEFSACTATSAAPPPAPTAVEFSSALDISWEPVPGASSYHIYVGTRPTLPGLATQDPDCCQVAVIDTTGGTLPHGSNPPPGHMLFFLVTSEGSFGESLAGPSSSGARQLTSAGDCEDSCAHSVCDVGAPLTPACTICSSIICDKTPSCCNGSWDASCVQQVHSVCRSLNCEASQGQCAHVLCDTGQPLAPGCDSPPLATSCTAAVCQAMPHCCSQAWDDTCIATMASVCGYGCI